MWSSGNSSTRNSPRRFRAMNSSKQSVAMTAMVGMLTSISEKPEASIVSASRSLAKANPLAFPPNAPVPIRVKRKVPSQKCRSNAGRSATTVLRSVIAPSGRHHSRRGAPHHRKGTAATAEALHPAAVVAGFGHSTDGNRVGRIPHGQLLTAGEFRNREVCRGHFEVKFSQYLVLLPEVVHVALDLLEIAASHATRIGQEVGNQQNAAFLDLNVGLRGCRTVGPLHDDPNSGADFGNVIAGNLVFHGRRNQDLDILLKPCLSGQQFVSQVLRLLLIDSTKTVGDRQNLVEINSIKLAVGVGALVLLVPTRHGDHSSSQPLVKFDRVVGHVAKSLDAGRGVLRPHTQLLESFSQGKDDAVTCRLGSSE